MKESTLEKVREEYTKIAKEKESFTSYKNELLKLANKNYMELSDDAMIMMAYQRVPEAFGVQNVNSNYIMIFMGSYIKNTYEEQNDDFITYERDPATSYRLYIDLETMKIYVISKDECLEFENKFITLYLPISEYTEEEYYKKYIELQNWFKIQLMNRSQSDLIKELKEKYEKKYKNIYPYFQRIDTITDLSIEDYVKAYPTDGFTENYCLSQEESMRVRLYRKRIIKKSDT